MCTRSFFRRFTIALLTLTLCVPLFAQTIAPDEQKLADVAAGKITQAHAIWWGFDATDSTAQLQAALDCNAPVIIVDCPVIDGKTLHGVEESELSSASVMLYPNPASGLLNISIADGIEIIQTCIYDLTGHCVWKNGFTTQIPVTHLSDGLYFVSLTTTHGQIITQKIIIRQ